MSGKMESAVIDLRKLKDCEVMEYLLTNAELDFEPGSGNGITSYYELESGLKLHFCDDGSFTGFELP
jgi:hypothetical protein